MSGGSPNVIRLALKIADSAARSDIECHCPPVGKNMPPRWDTQNVEACDRDFIDDALQYLELRGLVARDAQEPHIVTFPDEAWGR